MPGFLKGKFYGDFSDPECYKEKLDLLLRSVGTSKEMPSVSSNEIAHLKEELEAAKDLVEIRTKGVDSYRKVALRGKSEKLIRRLKRRMKDTLCSHPLMLPMHLN